MSLKEALLSNKVTSHDPLTNTEAREETPHSTLRFAVMESDKNHVHYQLSSTCGPTQGPRDLLRSSYTCAVGPWATGGHHVDCQVQQHQDHCIQKLYFPVHGQDDQPCSGSVVSTVTVSCYCHRCWLEDMKSAHVAHQYFPRQG